LWKVRQYSLHPADLGYCELGNEDVSILANALAIQESSILPELSARCNKITSVGLRALVDAATWRNEDHHFTLSHWKPHQK
jgi:hypothetical protein